jgi:hypothetical protein
MRRLFWIGVGAAAAVVVIRKAGALIESHTPAGVAQAAGAVTVVRKAVRTAREEFTAGLAEREADLRCGLLGDADLDQARSRADTWRANRADRDPAGTAPTGRGQGRRGRHSGPGADTAQAQDPSDDDGDLGYSFY